MTVRARAVLVAVALVCVGVLARRHLVSLAASLGRATTVRSVAPGGR